MINISGQSIAVVSDSISKNGKSNTFWAVVTLAGTAITLGGIYLVYTIVKDNNKHKNEIETLKVKTDLAIKQDNNKTKNRIDTIQTKAEVAVNKKIQKETLDTDIEVAPMQSLNDILTMKDVDSEDLILMYRFLQKGSTLGICGPTNIGKTTFLCQLLLNLYTGECEYPIAANYYPTKPQKVLLFSTEKMKKEIKYDYRALDLRYSEFMVETEGTSPEEILAKINMELDKANDEGLVIAIDNYTKLSEIYGVQTVKKLDRALSELQQKNQNVKPLTIIKVFHTDDNYREYNPVEIQHVKGTANIVNLTKNFIFLTKCRKGHEYRVLKEYKNKIDGPKETVSILKHAGTDPHQFVYVEETLETEALPLRPSHANSNSDQNQTQCANSGKRGRKETYNEADLRAMVEELDAGFTWREILESRGMEFTRNKTKGIKEAFKRHGIRGEK